MGCGVYQDRTLYKGTFELFRFETNADEIRFDLPETHTKVVSKFRIETVDGPKPFDLKLIIPADPRGPQVYWGPIPPARTRLAHRILHAEPLARL